MKNCGFRFKTTYTNLPDQFFTKIGTDTVASPDIIILNNELSISLGLDFQEFNDQELAELFSGNQLPKGSTPFSQAYAGHQFGYFSILGDGRAHVLGEHITPSGERVDVQFKGSGRTPYSRSGDGKAALGPMLREYIISEAMHYLGIPTTRSLAVVTTGEPVLRETVLSGAILTRVASSHIRVGTFEFAANQLDKKALELLMNYTIQRHYPDLKDSENKALSLIKTVMEKQAELIVHWMRVGFVHGVMNTDNMTLCGETIDYGPCAFMDMYDPNTVFSSIDHMGRYSFANQIKVAQWNLTRFAETLLQFIDDEVYNSSKIAKEMIDQFSEVFKSKWLMMMNTKLGLFDSFVGDDKLVYDLLDWMHNNNVDYTNFFLELGRLDKPNGRIYEDRKFEEWYTRWQNRLGKNSKSRISSICLMNSVNPTVIPRNHIVENTLEAAYRCDFKPLQDLLAVVKEPYLDSSYYSPYQKPPEPSNRSYQTFCGT